MLLSILQYLDHFFYDYIELQNLHYIILKKLLYLYILLNIKAQIIIYKSIISIFLLLSVITSKNIKLTSI